LHHLATPSVSPIVAFMANTSPLVEARIADVSTDTTAFKRPSKAPAPVEIAPKSNQYGDVVALDDRRHPIAMGLLWITMVTSFPSVLIGVEWYKNGFSLLQVVVCTILASIVVMLFCIPSAQIGSVTGQNYARLNRSVFGRWGARMTTFNLVALFLVFYAFSALCMADAVSGLFKVPLSIGVMAAGFAFLMCLNNLWGFSGVVNFAKYFAAPAMIAWVGFTFFRALAAINAAPAVAITPHAANASWPVALGAIASFVIGFSVWGNEADYWRHAKPGVKRTAIPLAVALCIGQIIFPVTGWMVAHISQLTDSAKATAFMNEFSFGGVALLAVIVIGAQYFACNDSNLYAVVCAFENLVKIPKKTLVLIYAAASAVVAFYLSYSGLAKSIETLCIINGIVIPSCTVILLCEWFLGRVIGPGQSRISHRLVEMHEIPALRIPAMVAFVCACFIGFITSGIVPGFDCWHVGIACLNAWLTAAVVYLPMRLIEYKLLLQKTSTQSTFSEI